MERATDEQQPFELDAVDVRPKSEEGIELEIYDPAGRPTGVILLVRGQDCQSYRDKSQQQLQRVIDRQGRKVSQDERDREFWELQATLIAGWKGKPLMRSGSPLQYSAANAALLLEQYDWLFEQVRKFSASRENFLPGPAKS